LSDATADAHVSQLDRRIRDYWNGRIHDLEMTTRPAGSREFFAELAEYRFEKLDYLPRVVDFSAYAGCRVLEVGCGIGTDLVRFARGDAKVFGIDLSETAGRLARTNLELHAPSHGGVVIGDGAALPLPDESVDLVYAHGVLQYSAHPRGIVEESQRVLRPGGRAIFMVYNRRSWLMGLSRVMKVPLEHADAPGLRLYSIAEFRNLVTGFREVAIVPERFPVRSRLHHGWKAAVYNGIFVDVFNAVPRALVRPLGWHLIAFCEK
jgi:SAM-dependent methyltransferase